VPDMIACQTFAGGFDMGATKAGLKLIHKVENMGGFGIPNVEANRHLVGYEWESQAIEPSHWEVMPAQVVIGNPPCSRPGSPSHPTWTSAGLTHPSTIACGTLSTT
jgi:hypothetical protein